jgi:hypothetical protein
MNVNQLLQELTWRVGNRSDIQPRTLVWLNDAYFELLLSPLFTFYQLDRSSPWVAQAGVRVTQLSSIIPGYWFIIDIRNDDFEQKLKKFDPTEMDKVCRTTGLPYRYGRFGDQIELDPTPDRDYNMTIRWRFRPPELVNGGDHLLTREWDEVLLTKAVQKGFEALEQWEKAKAQKLLADNALGRHQDVADMETIDHEITIGVALDGGS